MQRLVAPFALALGIAVAGCNSFGYISKTYVSILPQVVTIGCKEPYEVYDARQRRKMLVVSNSLREVTGCDISERYAGMSPTESRAARFREAARAFLDETVREDCKITGEIVFTDLQTEFAYSCDAPIEPRGTKTPRLPGRGRIGQT